MSDLFLSYSRKDSEQALALAKRLRGAGIDVWIDQHGIEAASSWSEEIVNAIESSKAFVVLLSSSSIESDNVVRELSLAMESKRPMIPIALQDISLPAKFKYQLAGIQRVAYTQFDAITQALANFGISAKEVAREDASATRKTLMILPFEDLSPTQDNGWFADGLVSEMIGKLSKVHSLKVVDRQTSLQIKKKGHTIAELASILEVRYFIEGSIRKFGEQIKVDTGLLDFETGDYLWQDSHKGVFADIFEIQETIADKVLEGLRLHLGSDEKKEVKKKLTENAEAYEFYLKAGEEYSRHTHASYVRASVLYREVVTLDPMFGSAFASLANSHLAIYRTYDRATAHLEQAEQAIAEVKRIEGQSAQWCWTMSILQRVKGDLRNAERYARLGIGIDRTYLAAYDALGFALQGQQRYAEAAEAFRECLNRRQNRTGFFNLLRTLHDIGDKEKLRAISVEALPLFEKQMKLNPEDKLSAVVLASLLYWSGRYDEAKVSAHELLRDPALDGVGLYNLTCLLLHLQDRAAALTALKKSVERGFVGRESFNNDPDLDPIRGTEEFKAIVAELEAKIAAHNAPPSNTEKGAAQ